MDTYYDDRPDVLDQESSHITARPALPPAFDAALRWPPQPPPRFPYFQALCRYSAPNSNVDIVYWEAGT